MGEASYTARLGAAILEKERATKALYESPLFHVTRVAIDALDELKEEGKRNYENYMKQQEEKADAED